MNLKQTLLVELLIFSGGGLVVWEYQAISLIKNGSLQRTPQVMHVSG